MRKIFAAGTLTLMFLLSAMAFARRHEREYLRQGLDPFANHNADLNEAKRLAMLKAKRWKQDLASGALHGKHRHHRTL